MEKKYQGAEMWDLAVIGFDKWVRLFFDVVIKVTVMYFKRKMLIIFFLQVSRILSLESVDIIKLFKKLQTDL